MSASESEIESKSESESERERERESGSGELDNTLRLGSRVVHCVSLVCRVRNLYLHSDSWLPEGCLY